MKRITQILLFGMFALLSPCVKAQTETAPLVEHLQTANFNKLLSYWDNQVEVNFPNFQGQKQYNASEANEMLHAFFNQHNIIGFEKNAERKVGSTIYLTGKLLSGNAKYNLTLLLQDNKQRFTIVSVRVS